jgi:hypothetical protein
MHGNITSQTTGGGVKVKTNNRNSAYDCTVLAIGFDFSPPLG